jgi:WD40 repeat protein
LLLITRLRKIIACVFSLSAMTVNGYTQSLDTPTITVNSGHDASGIQSAALSKDGNYLVTAGLIDETIRIWDSTTGRVLKVLSGVSAAGNLKFFGSRNTFAFGNKLGEIGIYEIGSSAPIRFLRGHTQWVSSLDISPDGKYLVSASWDGTVRLWDLVTGAQLKSLSGSPFHHVRFVAEGRKFVSYSEDYRLKTWETKSLELLRTQDLSGSADVLNLEGSNNAISVDQNQKATLRDVQTGAAVPIDGIVASHSTFAVSGDGTQLAGFGKSGGLQIWDAITGRLLRSIGEGNSFKEISVNSLQFSADKRYVAYSGEVADFILWDQTTGQQLSRLNRVEPPQIPPARPGFTNDEKRLFVFTQSRFLWIEFLTSKRMMGLSLVGNNMRRDARSADPSLQTFIETSFKGLPVENYAHLNSFHLRENTAYDRKIIDELTLKQGKFSEVFFSESGSSVVTKGREGLTAWDVSSPPERLLAKQTIPIILYPTSISPDGSIFVYRDATDYTGRIWNIAKNSIVQLSTPLETLSFSRDGRAFVSAGNGNLNLHESATGKVLKTLKTPESYIDRVGVSSDNSLVAVRGKAATILDLSSGRALSTLQIGEWLPEEFIFSTDKRFVLSRQPVIQVWDVATGRLLVSSMTFQNGEWVTITPEGYFDSSANGAKNLNVVRGLSATSIDQYYQMLHRPDLVQQKLAGDPAGKVKAAAAQLDLTKAASSGNVPMVKIVGPSAPLPNGVKQANIQANISDQGGGIGKVEWRINGTTVGVDAAGTVKANGTGATSTANKMFSLVIGENRIEVIAYNGEGLVASLPASIIVSRGPEAGDGGGPRLYVLAVGVNDYWDSKLRLNFAVQDAKSLSDGLREAGKKLYEKTEVITVLDSDATAANLNRVFADVSGRVRPQDVFVYFMSGHGKTVDGRFYFIPQDFHYTGEDSIVESGIGQDQLQKWLASISAQKSILLFDACESGALIGDRIATRGMEEKTAIDLMTRATGRTTLTATTDDKPAAEGYRGHGVFTYALLEGLGDADANGDGVVDVLELADFIDRTVPQLTYDAWKMRQVPQMKIVGSNFPLVSTTAILSRVGTDATNVPTMPTHVIIAPASVRQTANSDGPIVTTLTSGSQVRLINAEGGWVLIGREGKKLGYVEAKNLVVLQ